MSISTKDGTTTLGREEGRRGGERERGREGGRERESSFNYLSLSFSFLPALLYTITRTTRDPHIMLA